MTTDWSRPGNTYHLMVQDYAQAKKLKSYPVINRREHQQQWAQWLEYFRFRKLGFQVERMAEKGQQTVPCMSPFDFDPEYRQPELVPRERRYRDLDDDDFKHL